MSVTRDLSHWGGDAWRGFTQATAGQTACRMLSAGCSNGLPFCRRLFDYGNASGWGDSSFGEAESSCPCVPCSKQQSYMICRPGDHSLPALTLHVAARMLGCGGPKSTLLVRGGAFRGRHYTGCMMAKG